MTTPDDALPSWIDDAAAIKWVAERACVNPERDWDIDDVGEAFRAGQAHADAGLLEAIAGPEAWLDSWAQHVGNCQGGYVCTCGLTRARSELSAAIAAGAHKQTN
jgi:hypothetical protein